MGNRAVITTRENFDNDGIGIYVHWNGGRDSVEAFLAYCEARGFRSPSQDDSYGFAQLARVIGNFFGNGLSLGINRVGSLDCNNYDNGVYIIDGWNIVGREYFKGDEQNSYDLVEMLIAIDEAQPPKEQLGAKYFKATPKKREDLKIGDFVYVFDCDGKYSVERILGFGEDRFVNGMNVKGLPFVLKYNKDGRGLKAVDNPNNYLTEEVYRVVSL